jgi:hypothetical protein
MTAGQKYFVGQDLTTLQELSNLSYKIYISIYFLVFTLNVQHSEK